MSETFVWPDHADMIANIKGVYNSATAEQILNGSNWYNDAANLARSLAESSGYSLAQTAGVIAALSPNTGWGQNVRLAVRMVESRGVLAAGGLSLNLAKARTILALDGSGADILESIASILFGKNANKVLAFWRGIVADGHTDQICVDRHAFCIAVNDRGMTQKVPTLTPARYAALCAAYRDAAVGSPYSAAQVQAITWVTWRERYWAVGAYSVR